MKHLVTGILLLVGVGLYGQTQPNNFTEITNVNNSNFEVYSQKGGLPRRASLNTLKRFFDQAISLSGDTLYLSAVDSNYVISLDAYRRLSSNIDVNASGVGDNFMLKYNSSLNKWQVYLHNIDNLTDAFASTTEQTVSFISNLYQPYGSLVWGYDNLSNRSPYNTVSIGNNIGFGDASNLPGSFNVFIGNNTADSLVASNYNVHVGHLAGKETTTSAFNTFVGYLSGQFNVRSEDNTYLGSWSGRSAEAGTRSTFIGRSAGSSIDTSTNSIVIGAYANTKARNTTNEIVIGTYGVGQGNNSTVLGTANTDSTFIYGTLNFKDYGAGNKEDSDIGKTESNYAAVFATDGSIIEKPISELGGGGSETLAGLNDVDTSGIANNYTMLYNAGTFEFSPNSINSLTDGYTDNTGGLVLVSTPASVNNSILLGKNNFTGEALSSTISIGNNIGIGSNGASNSIFLGHATASLLNENGSPAGLVHIGNEAGYGTTSGYLNVMIGLSTGRGNTTGGENAYIGSYAGYFLNGSGNVLAGADAGFNARTLENSVLLGKNANAKNINGDTNEIVIGANALGEGSNTVTLGNNDIAGTYLKGTINLRGYGAGNKEDTDLSKTESGYIAAIATDGTVLEKPVSELLGSATLASLDDVDTSGIGNNYTMLYNAGTFEFAPNSIDNLTDGYTQGTHNLILGREPAAGYNGVRSTIITRNGFSNVVNVDDYSAGMIVIGDNAYNTATKASAGVVAIGNNAMRLSNGAESTTAIGAEAGERANSSSSVFLGTGAGKNLSATPTLANTFLGANTANNMTSGSRNTIIGAFAEGVNGDNQIVIGSGTSSSFPYYNYSKGPNSAKIGNTQTDSTFLHGNLNLEGYGAGNKEASDLSKTESGYLAAIATDGTIVETDSWRPVFQKIVSSNSADTITVLAKSGAASLATSNSRAQYDVTVSKLAEVQTLSFVMDLTVGNRRTETIIKIDDASNTSNMDMSTLMFPIVSVYDAAPTLLDVKQAYNVTETLTNGDLPYDITWNNDGTYNIVFGKGDWGSKTKVVVTVKF